MTKNASGKSGHIACSMSSHRGQGMSGAKGSLHCLAVALGMRQFC